MFNNGWCLIDHGTLKSSISHKWFDESSRLIEWFLHADSDGKNNFGFDGQYTLNLRHLNAGGPLQLYLTINFLEKILFGQKWPQNRVFPLLWKFVPLILAGNVLK